MNFPAFRDWIVVPYYYHIYETVGSIGWVEQIVYNWLTQWFDGRILVWAYACVWLCVGFLIAFYTVPRLIAELYNQSALYMWQKLCISVIYVCNYWTIERYLMGQIHIVRGYMLMPFVLFLMYQYGQKKSSFLFKYSKIWFACAFLLLAYVSIHMAFLMMCIVGIRVVLHALYTIQHTLNTFSFHVVLKKVLLTCSSYASLLFASVPACIYMLWSAYEQSRSQQYFFSQSDTVFRSVVESFSLQVSQARGAHVLGLLATTGAGSWMNNTFVELEYVEQTWGVFTYAISYFSTIGSFIATVGIITCAGWGMYYALKNVLHASNHHESHNIQRMLFVISLIVVMVGSYIASFGASLGGFGDWYIMAMNVPLFSIMREGGKWYSMVLLCFCIIGLGGYFTFWNNAYTQQKSAKSYMVHAIMNVAIVWMTCSTVLFGMITVMSSNTVVYPEIYSRINAYCINNQSATRALYVPHETYIQSEYSGLVFIENHLYRSSPCDFIKPEYVTIGQDNTAIRYTEFDTALSRVVYSSLCDTEALNEFAQKYHISLFVIDRYFYPELDTFYTCLENNSAYFTLLFEEGGIAVYEMKAGE